MNWKEITPAKIRTFQLGDEPELVHIIKTGFDEERNVGYMIIHEDAYETVLGIVEFGSKQEIEKRFGIKL